MTKDAWVLKLKEEVSSAEYDGRPFYLCDDESVDFLTGNLNEATVIFNKEEQIQEFKYHDKFFIERFGEDSVRNFGWENISKHFNFVEVEVEESE